MNVSDRIRIRIRIIYSIKMAFLYSYTHDTHKVTVIHKLDKDICR